MAKSGFQYKLTMKEMWCMFFRAKKCRNCGGRLVRHKGCEITDGRSVNTRRDSFFTPNAVVRNYYFYYVCQRCGKSILLKELAND